MTKGHQHPNLYMSNLRTSYLNARVIYVTSNGQPKVIQVHHQVDSEIASYPMTSVPKLSEPQAVLVPHCSTTLYSTLISMQERSKSQPMPVQKLDESTNTLMQRCSIIQLCQYKGGLCHKQQQITFSSRMDSSTSLQA